MGCFVCAESCGCVPKSSTDKPQTFTVLLNQPVRYSDKLICHIKQFDIFDFITHPLTLSYT